MKYHKILNIEKLPSAKETYDIHHNLPVGAFNEDQPNLLTKAGLISNCGRHAGGVVLTDSPLEKENMPLVIGGKGAKRSLQTPWTEGINFRMLEHFGFLKFDFLALGTLRLFERTVEKILRKETGKKHIQFEEVQKWFNEKLSPDVNPMTDEKVYKNVFWDGRFAGIFQFVTPQTQSFMKRMKPKCINDIAIATSIHRPGPLGIGVDNDFLNNRLNPSNIKYAHPILEEVLGETSNCLSGDTLVKTEKGEIKISEIVDQEMIGLKLPSYNTESGIFEEDEIVAVKKTEGKELIEIITETGTIELTEDHVIFTTKGEKKVKDLELDDEILSLNT